MTAGATISKYRLARRLAGLRRDARMTPDEAAAKSGVPAARLARIENNQWTDPSPADITLLLDAYQAGSGTRTEIRQLTDATRSRLWWRDYGEIFNNEYPGFEQDADTILGCSPGTTLPALLWTPAYADAVVNAETRAPAWRRRALEAVRRRQQVLGRADPPRFTTVISTTALHAAWGSPADRAAQIRHLADASRRPRISLRVIKSASGLTPSLCGTMSAFGFNEGEQLVWLDSPRGVQPVTDPEQASEQLEAFKRVCGSALEEEDTTVFLEQLAAKMTEENPA